MSLLPPPGPDRLFAQVVPGLAGRSRRRGTADRDSSRQPCGGRERGRDLPRARRRRARRRLQGVRYDPRSGRDTEACHPGSRAERGNPGSMTTVREKFSGSVFMVSGFAASGRPGMTIRGASPPAVRQVLVLDREDAVLLDVDAANDAGPTGLVGELDIVAARRNPDDAQPLVVIDRSVRIVRTLIGAPGILAGRRKLQIRHGRGGEGPDENAFALAVGRKDRVRAQRRNRDGEEECTHPRAAGEAGGHCRTARSRFRALSRFFAASRPTGAISLAELRSAPARSASASVAPLRSAPASKALTSEAPVKSARLSDANSRSTRARSAPRRFAPSRLADVSTARISPMD